MRVLRADESRTRLHVGTRAWEGEHVQRNPVGRCSGPQGINSARTELLLLSPPLGYLMLEVIEHQNL